MISLHRALTVDRTSAAEAYRASVLLTLQINDDIARLWEWKAQAGACKFCQSMDGTRHPIDEDMQSHPNCFCVQQVVAKGA